MDGFRSPGDLSAQPFGEVDVFDLTLHVRVIPLVQPCLYLS